MTLDILTEALDTLSEKGMYRNMAKILNQVECTMPKDLYEHYETVMLEGIAKNRDKPTEYEANELPQM